MHPFLDAWEGGEALRSKRRGPLTVLVCHLSADSPSTPGAHSHVAVGREMRAIFWKNNLDIYHFVNGTNPFS